jgi:signal transduction histidine kinase
MVSAAHPRPTLRLVRSSDPVTTADAPAPHLPATTDPDYANRVRLALYAADVGAWDYDLQTGAVWWDPRSAELLGARSESVRTYPGLLGLVHPDDRAPLTASWQPFLDPEREGECYEFVFRTADTDDWFDAERRVAIRGRMLFATVDGVRRATRLLGTIREVTGEWERDAERERLLAVERRARYEAEVASTEQARFLVEQAKFVGNVSRTFQTSIDAMARQAALLELGAYGPLTPEQLEALNRLRSQQQVLLEAVATVLEQVRDGLPVAGHAEWQGERTTRPSPRARPA